MDIHCPRVSLVSFWAEKVQTYPVATFRLYTEQTFIPGPPATMYVDVSAAVQFKVRRHLATQPDASSANSVGRSSDCNTDVSGKKPTSCVERGNKIAIAVSAL